MDNNTTHLHEPVLDYARYDIPFLDQCLTVGDALSLILEKGVGERIIYFYVVDEERHLLGVIPTRRLLTSPHPTRLRDIMISRVVRLPESATVYDALEQFVLHRFLAFPIVDRENHLLGVVDINLFTDEMINFESSRGEVDAIFETIGFHISELRNAGPLRVFRIRFPWLLATIASGSIAAFITGGFEATLAEHLLLAFFLTLMLGLGESVSTQSMTITLQTLSSMAPTMEWYLRELRRQISSAVFLGAAASVIMMLVTLVWRGLNPALPVVGLSIFLIICNAAAVGLTVPSLLHALRLNPEVAAGPVTLAMVDIFTLLFYFGTATLIL